MKRLWIPIALTAGIAFALSRVERVHRGVFIEPEPTIPGPGGLARVNDQVVVRFREPTDLQELGVPSRFAVAAFLTVEAADERTVSGPITAYSSEGADSLTVAIDILRRGGFSADTETPGTRFLSQPSSPITLERRVISAVYRQGQKIG